MIINKNSSQPQEEVRLGMSSVIVNCLDTNKPTCTLVITFTNIFDLEYSIIFIQCSPTSIHGMTRVLADFDL